MASLFSPPPATFPHRKRISAFSANLTTSSISAVKRLSPSTLRLRQSPISPLFSIKPSPKPYRPKSTPNTITSLFTGIVEEMGTIKQLGFSDQDIREQQQQQQQQQEENSFTMRIAAKIILEDIHLGDSISVNGTCLTVTQYDTVSSEFSVGLSPETLRKTNLGELESGSWVNLERAVSPTTRMGGHFVQGHVDGTGEIVEMTPEGDSLWVKVKVDKKELLRFIVPKGYVAVDGTSLTVVDVFDDESCFNLMLVAYTQQKIVIPLKKIGQKVNLEVDVLGKYVERLLSSGFVESIAMRR